MKGKVFLAVLGFLYIGMAGGCSQPAPDLRYQIEVDKPLQTMEHFGASDAWSMHILGLWPQEKQNQIADWLCQHRERCEWKTERNRLVSVAFQRRCR